MRLPLSALVLAFALQSAFAQNASTYRIAGTVVSAIDHHPLQRASIQLLNPDDQKLVQSTTSDEYGRFAFTGIPAGNLELQGNAPNYLATFYQEHDGFNTGIITGAGVDTESLVLELQPTSVIGGIVRDESGDPVENATIYLFREGHDFGDGRIVPAGTASTDDLGRFEFAHLKPGSYYLAVIAIPWYVVYPPTPPDTDTAVPEGYRRAFPRQPSTTFVESIDPAVNVAYAVTFYPGTTDPNAAAPIPLRSGDTKDLALQLHSQPALTLTLPRAARKGQPQNQPQDQPQLNLSFLGQPLRIPAQTIQTQSHTIISGLAPGDYILSSNRAASNPLEGVPIQIVDHSLTAEPPDSVATAHVHVSVRALGNTQLPEHARVVLGGPGTPNAAIKNLDEKNQATLDVVPGDYSFGILGIGLAPAINQVIAGEQPLPTNHVHLSADQSAFFTLVVSARTHTLRAVARKDGKPCPGALILLFRTAELTDIRSAREVGRQQSDLDGSFDLRGLAPGDYTLLAIDNGWDIDWRDPTMLLHYLPTATQIHIPDTGNNTQTLARPIAVQPR